ncbi:MAG: RNA polymerase sigma factor [bacterium]
MEQSLSDKQLINAYLEGDRKSLELLIQRHLLAVYRFAYQYVGNKQDAEDIVQDTFVKVWKHLKRFDVNQPFKPWLYRIAKNTAFDFLKKKKTIPFSMFEDEEGNNVVLDTLVDGSPLPDQIIERKEMSSYLNSLLEQLAPIYRQVMEQYYNCQLTFQEIADKERESINTIKSRHRRALLLLRQMLGA